MELDNVTPGSTTMSAEALEALRVELERRHKRAGEFYERKEADFDQESLLFAVTVTHAGTMYRCSIETSSSVEGGGARGYLVADNSDCSDVFCYNVVAREGSGDASIMDIQLVQMRAIVKMDADSRVGDASTMAAPYLLGLLKFQHEPNLCYAGG
jgi:hypothetical protein